MKQSLSPKELAQVIGVSESSLKRWADGGRVRVTRTMGGHRRIAIQEAVRFAREARLPVVRPEILGISTVGKVSAQQRGVSPQEAGRLFEDFLMKGKAEEARGLLLDLYLKGKSVAWLCDEPIRTAMLKVGDVWNHDSKGIYIEHRAIDVCIHALSQIRLLLAEPTLDPGLTQDDAAPPRPVALGGAPSNDPYILGSLMCSCVAAESGYRDVNLGADLPLDSLVEAVEQYRPKLVWLSCSHDNAVPAPKAIDELADRVGGHGGRLVVGGRANPRGNGRSENLRVCESMTELGAFASGLLSS
ncbi:MAG: hypothetical protein AAFX76_10985 [Planctomycetota bacterium]